MRVEVSEKRTLPRSVMAAKRVASGSALDWRMPITVPHESFYTADVTISDPVPNPTARRAAKPGERRRTDFWNLCRYSCAFFFASCSPLRIVMTAPRTSVGAKASWVPFVAISGSATGRAAGSSRGGNGRYQRDFWVFEERAALMGHQPGGCCWRRVKSCNMQS
jgi:hypothetical protein